MPLLVLEPRDGLFFVEYRRLKNAIVIYNYAWSTEANQIFIINNTISTKWV